MSKETKCKHEGYWFSIKFLFIDRKFLWCYRCLKSVKRSDVFKNADILHKRPDGYFVSSSDGTLCRKSIEKIKELAKTAHFIDLKFRNNGEDKIVQADFLREILKRL